jgi:hypothetical protein
MSFSYFDLKLQSAYRVPEEKSIKDRPILATSSALAARKTSPTQTKQTSI